MPLSFSRKTVLFLFCTYGLLLSCTGGSNSSRTPPPQGATGCEPKRNDNGKDLSYDLTADADLWQDVKTLLQNNCTSCHARFADFEIASGKIDSFIRYTDLNEGDDGFMPKGGAKLSLEDRAKFVEWRAAGLPGIEEEGGEDITLGDDGGGSDDTDGNGDDGGKDDTSGIDTDGSDWGDDPPPPPSASTGC